MPSQKGLVFEIVESYTCPLKNLNMFDPYSLYTKCENSCEFAKKKPQSVVTTALL